MCLRVNISHLVKAETLVDMSPVVVSETILADVAVCGSPASFPPVLLLDVCVVLPRVTYVLKRNIIKHKYFIIKRLLFKLLAKI